jgi:hypothetical protein
MLFFENKLIDLKNKAIKISRILSNPQWFGDILGR